MTKLTQAKPKSSVIPKNSPHKIRIIGGTHKRSLIPVPDVPGLRPTPDRVRETLFNWITHLWSGNFSDKAVLDLFAGTGALGFEAASRGSMHVQMIETNKIAQANLRQLRDKLELHQVRIQGHDALMMVKRVGFSRFDLIMLDPPFDSNLLEQVKPILSSIVKPGGLVYVESGSPPELSEEFTLLRQSKAGMVYFRLFQFNPIV